MNKTTLRTLLNKRGISLTISEKQSLTDNTYLSTETKTKLFKAAITSANYLIHLSKHGVQTDLDAVSKTFSSDWLDYCGSKVYESSVLAYLIGTGYKRDIFGTTLDAAAECELAPFTDAELKKIISIPSFQPSYLSVSRRGIPLSNFLESMLVERVNPIWDVNVNAIIGPFFSISDLFLDHLTEEFTNSPFLLASMAKYELLHAFRERKTKITDHFSDKAFIRLAKCGIAKELKSILSLYSLSTTTESLHYKVHDFSMLVSEDAKNKINGIKKAQSFGELLQITDKISIDLKAENSIFDAIFTLKAAYQRIERFAFAINTSGVTLTHKSKSAIWKYMSQIDVCIKRFGKENSVTNLLCPSFNTPELAKLVVKCCPIYYFDTEFADILARLPYCVSEAICRSELPFTHKLETLIRLDQEAKYIYSLELGLCAIAAYESSQPGEQTVLISSVQELIKLIPATREHQNSKILSDIARADAHGFDPNDIQMKQY